MPLDPLPDWVPARRREIGARLRVARLHAGLTQLELGRRVGRENRTIHRWEYGERVPSLDDLLLLADALGVPLPLLVERAAVPDGGCEDGRDHPATGPIGEGR